MPTITLPHNFTPRDYQLPFFEKMDGGCKRAILKWHRRSGKDLATIHFTAKSCFQRVGNYYHCLPYYDQARKAIWDGKDNAGRPFIDAFPKAIIQNQNNQQMKVELKNKSIWQLIGADNVDTIVGTNPVGIVFSEFPLMRPNVWDILRPILAANGGWAVFIYTPRGKNHAYDLEEYAKTDPANWFFYPLNVYQTGAISAEIIEREKQELFAKHGNNQLFEQEYMVSSNAALQGSYYGDQCAAIERTGRFSSVPYDNTVPVHTVWDLGISDSTAIGFWQAVGQERRLIEYVEYNGKGLPDIVLDLKRKDYIYGRHFAPHDIKARELGTGKSRLETAEALGLNFEVVPSIPLQDGIDATRSFLSKVWIDKDKAAQLMRILPLYARQFDERTHDFKETPFHDYTSHGADMMRYSALVSDQMDNGQRQQAQVTANPVTVTAYNYNKARMDRITRNY